MNPPNILLVVWDACRYDYAQEHASFLNELAAANLSFKNAVAPSPWSLPSHASIFNGEHPHEHGSYRLGDSVDTPLVRELSDSGYTTYSVSANGFASQRTGFEADFDEFLYTGGRDRYIDGMDVSGAAQRVLNHQGGTFGNALKQVLSEIPQHDYLLRSLVNLAAVGAGEVATKFEYLQRIPHPIFAPTSDYSYAPEKNTSAIRSMLDGHDDSKPFFLFTNYMDTHRCYKPDLELQEKHIGRQLEYSELIRLNEEVAAPWEFEAKKERGELEEKDIKTLRGLYAGEVETADEHLRKIFDILEKYNFLEDTLVVITADHGENLGEVDKMGRRRMGHEASVSDAVLRVPLIIAHPELNPQTVTKEVSLDYLYDLILSAAKGMIPGGKTLLDMVPDAPGTSQYPATGGGDETLNKYPEIHEEMIRHRSSENSAVVYDDGWKFVAESTGKRWAFDNGESVEETAVPRELVTLGVAHLNELSKSSDRALSNREVSQLEALGYL